MENLLGWGESAKDMGRSWTANERDMSAASRLYKHYKLPRETAEKIILQSPNRQKGQVKGEGYLDSLFKKLEKGAGEKNKGALTLQRRTTIDLTRVFGAIPALLFSDKKTVTVKGVETPDGRKVDVKRIGDVGMNNSRARILLWALSNTRYRSGDKYIGRTIEIPFEKFAQELMGLDPGKYKTRRKFNQAALIYFKRTVKGLNFLRFGISDYYQLQKSGDSSDWAISPFQSFQKKGEKVIITLSHDMEFIYSDPGRLKRVEKKFLIFLGQTRQTLVPALALWLGENFYDKKNAGGAVLIEPTILKYYLQGRPGQQKPKEMSEKSRKKFRDEIYKAVREINNHDLLRQVGSSARKVDVISNREAMEFEFSVSQIRG